MKKKNIYRDIVMNILVLCIIFIFINILAYSFLWYWYCLKKGLPFEPLFYRYVENLPSISKDMEGICRMSRSDIYKNWQAAEIGAYKYEPWVGIGQKKRNTAFINIEENGSRSIQRDLPAENSAAIKIFVFGGSTTFGNYILDKDTIPAYIQDYIALKYPGRQFITYNYGRPAYYSKQEFVFLWSLLMKGCKPDLVIFIDGLNEASDESSVYSLELEKLFNIANDKEKFYFRDTCYLIMDILPVTHLLKKINVKLRRTPVSAKNKLKSGTTDSSDHLEAKKERYLLNQQIIRALAQEMGFSPYFFLQPIPGYKNNFRNHLFLSEAEFLRYFPETIDLLDLLDKETNNQDFISLADVLRDYKGQPFVDSSHYTREVCRLIAKQIVNHINLARRAQ